MHPITRERERERNDPFEPDDDVNDAKISLTFFLSSSRVSLSKHARLYILLGPRTRTKKKPIPSLGFSRALLFLLASQSRAQQHVKRLVPKTRFERLRRTNPLLLLLRLRLSGEKKKSKKTPL